MKQNSILILLLLCSLFSKAQQPSVPATQEFAAMKLFFEKTYVQLDRDYYASGDTIWYAAFLVNGKSTSLTSTSNNLYVELVSPTLKIIDRRMIRLDGGLGYGDINLKDSLASGWYHVRAYTNWMRNFKDNFIFQKKIYIKNSIGLKEKVPVATAVKTKSLTFYPEGGSLVEGLSSIVAFKAIDNQGDGVLVNGSIVSSKGDTVTSFTSTELGLGIFAFTPKTGEKYMATGYFGTERFSTPLPNVLSKGLSLHAVVDSTSIKATISANAAAFAEIQSKTLTITIKHAGEVVYSGNMQFTKPTVTVNIAINGLPEGVAALTVFDHLNRPNCERLVYIQSDKKITLTVASNKTTYAKREEATLKVKAQDATGNSVKTSFAMAVTDATIPDDGNDIVSYLMLQSELKGEIKNAAQYFDVRNKSRFKQLDLLLLTQGWRDYIWKKDADSVIKIAYLPEPGITIKGLVREKLANKPMPNMNITLFGTDFNGGKLFYTKTDQYGKYYLDGLNWFGNQMVKLTAQDGKGKKGGWLQIDTAYKELPVTGIKGVQKAAPLTVAEELAKRMAYLRTYKTGDGINLNEINIIGSKTETIQLLDQSFKTYGYPDQVFNITAADYTFKGLEHFLLTKVKGAVPVDNTLADTASGNFTEEGVAFVINGKKTWPRLLINGREETQGRLDYYSLTMDQINKIVVRRLIGATGGELYFINLFVKDSAFSGPNMHLLNVSLNGYYQAKTFYLPNYAVSSPATKNLRTTIFWAPSLKTNENGEAVVKYFNADHQTSISVKAGGITSDGKAVSTQTTYKVQ